MSRWEYRVDGDQLLHPPPQGQPHCSLPNACPLTTRELPGETLRLHTCVECPNNYPWLLDPTGDGFSF